MALLFFQKTIFTPLYGLNSQLQHFYITCHNVPIFVFSLWEGFVSSAKVFGPAAGHKKRDLNKSSPFGRRGPLRGYAPMLYALGELLPKPCCHAQATTWA